MDYMYVLSCHRACNHSAAWIKCQVPEITPIQLPRVWMGKPISRNSANVWLWTMFGDRHPHWIHNINLLIWKKRIDKMQTIQKVKFLTIANSSYSSNGNQNSISPSHLSALSHLLTFYILDLFSYWRCIDFCCWALNNIQPINEKYVSKILIFWFFRD